MIPVTRLPTDRALLFQQGVPLIHRDLSWIQFNLRVLAEAQDAHNPLLERAKFLAITASNLDEFFMIRVSAVARGIQRAKRSGAAEELAGREQVWQNLHQQVAQMTHSQRDTLLKLAAELEGQGIKIHWDGNGGESLFREQVLPRLDSVEKFTPNKLHSLKNLQMAWVGKSSSSKEWMWVVVNKGLPAVYSFWDPSAQIWHVYFRDILIEAYLGRIHHADEQSGVVRLTRDGDVTSELTEEDPDAIAPHLRSSHQIRDGRVPMRLQYRGQLSDEHLRQFGQALRMKSEQVIEAPETTVLQGLWSLVKAQPMELRAVEKGLLPAAFTNRIPEEFPESPEALFSKIKTKDILLHHPYDSFEALIRFIELAADDPQVISLAMTIYRIDSDSPIIAALIRAAQKGKKVSVFIELRARFEEMNNLELADRLKQSGIHVGHGLARLKLHAKVALIERKEGGLDQRYVHLSTGNYNAATAKAYTDLAILTADLELGNDARLFFNALSKKEAPSQFKRLVAAPSRLHRRVIALIEAEMAAAQANRPARIVAKMNALVDELVIEQLYRAAQAGVKIDLIVRGACSLIPGVKGLSENIRVISIIDRLLEHSRIYYFENSKVLYCSSADWMQRNFFSRLELAFPITDPDHFEFITKTVLPAYLQDNENAWELLPTGHWQRVIRNPGVKPFRSQVYFEALWKK